MKKYLLIGCGNNRKNGFADNGVWDGELTTLDIDSSCNPDVEWDLNFGKMPFPNNAFDEIHAYEVLEHLGKQGDYRFFFRQFEEFARILRPDGYIKLTVPWWQSEWAYGDPGHTRVLPPSVFVFLDQAQYDKQVGKTTMTDYRKTYKADFTVIAMELNDPQLVVVMQVKK